MAKYGTQCMCDHGVRLKNTVWTVGVGGRYKMPNPQESLPRLRGFSIQGLWIKVSQNLAKILQPTLSKLFYYLDGLKLSRHQNYVGFLMHHH